jgi:tetratricopeptide (TPR) repeat protein
LKRLPNNEEALEALGEALLYQDQDDKDREAIKYFQQIIDRNPRNGFAADNLAFAYLRVGNPSSARDVLTKSLAVQPRNPPAHFYLGQALEDLDQSNAALAEYRRALELDPQLYEAQMALAKLYEQHNQLQQAVLSYEAAAKMHPDDPDPLRALARAFAAAGNTEQAESALTRLHQLEKQQEQQQQNAPGTAKPGR